MKNFHFSVPQDIVFGSGSLEKLPKVFGKMGGNKAFIISGPNVLSKGIVDRARKLLQDAGIEVSVFTDIIGGPTIKNVEKAEAAYKASGADTIIAIGGGSVMDISKAVATVARYGGIIEDYEGRNVVKGPAEGLIFVPTTAGSGSETTGYAEIIDEENHYRFSVFSFNLLPEFSILDPELILDMDRVNAAELGMEAITNAIEAYISTNANILTDSMCEKALELLGNSIRAYVGRRDDIAAAEEMLAGSLLAGLAVSWTSFGLAHAMAGAVNANFDISFARANALLLEEILSLNSVCDKGKYYEIYRRLFGTSMKKEDFRTEILVLEINELMSEIKIDTDIVSDTDSELIDELSKDVMENEAIANVPYAVEEADVKDILGRLLL